MTYVCVTNKTKDLKIHVFQMITGKIESKVLRKDISSEFKYRFDGKKCNSNQMWNNDKCQSKYKKHNIRGKDYIWNVPVKIENI